MAKRIRLSKDNGATYFTLPGNGGELQNELGELVDTIFGQEFSSTESGLFGWQINSNAVFKGFAGYVTTIKRRGTSTAMTSEATARVTNISPPTFAITDTTKQVWDTGKSLTVFDDGDLVSINDIVNIDYLFGRVTFPTGYTPTGAITVTGSYFPLADLCGAKSFTLTQTAEGIDDTDMCIAQTNGGNRIMSYGLKTVSLETSGIYKSANAILTTLQEREDHVIEINPDGGGDTVARGIFRLASQGQSGDVGALEEETVSWRLMVPDTVKLKAPFAWIHTSSTTINRSIRIALDAWEDNTIIAARYLPMGNSGVGGDVVVTEISLSGGLEAMNEFSVTLQGTGPLSTV